MSNPRMGTIARALAWLTVGAQMLLGRAGLAAQDIDVQINPVERTVTPWYGLWWVWVLVAVFIIVIVALTTRGGERRA